jgi:hypothetical protein
METMTISRKIDKPDHPPLYMDNNDISTVSEHKHLGLVISDNGSWEKHIDMITDKANKRINILRKFKFILDRKTLEKIYFTFVGPLLEYADVIWDNMSMSLNEKIENVQLEASRIHVVTGGTRLISFNNLYMETGWEKLKDRREKHKLVQFYKMTKNVMPHYISCLVPQSFANIHNYNTNCICGSTESTAHYLFHCLRYTAQRQMYINSINVPINLTTEILLFGSPKLAPNQKVELFLAVQKFVICSKRFTP